MNEVFFKIITRELKIHMKIQKDDFRFLYGSLTNFEIFMFYFGWTLAIAAFPYYAYVLSNTVFTTSHLTTSDVPYYSTDPFLTLGSDWFDRYHFDWYVVISDAFYVVTPIFEVHFLTIIYLFGGYDFRYFNIAFLGITFITKTVTLFIRAYQYVFCSDFQLCRNWDPTACSSGAFNCPANPVWQYMFWYNFVFVIFMIIYITLVFGKFFKSNYEDYIKEWIDEIIIYKKLVDDKMLVDQRKFNHHQIPQVNIQSRFKINTVSKNIKEIGPIIGGNLGGIKNLYRQKSD